MSNLLELIAAARQKDAEYKAGIRQRHMDIFSFWLSRLGIELDAAPNEYVINVDGYLIALVGVTTNDNNRTRYTHRIDNGQKSMAEWLALVYPYSDRDVRHGRYRAAIFSDLVELGQLIDTNHVSRTGWADPDVTCDLIDWEPPTGTRATAADRLANAIMDMLEERHGTRY